MSVRTVVAWSPEGPARATELLKDLIGHAQTIDQTAQAAIELKSSTEANELRRQLRVIFGSDWRMEDPSKDEGRAAEVVKRMDRAAGTVGCSRVGRAIRITDFTGELVGARLTYEGPAKALLMVGQAEGLDVSQVRVSIEVDAFLKATSYGTDLV